MFKRVLSLCVALVLVVGASSGDLFAAEEDIQIKVILPAANSFAKIGDTVRVHIMSVAGNRRHLDELEIAISDQPDPKVEDVDEDTPALNDAFGRIGEGDDLTMIVERYHYNLDLDYVEAVDAVDATEDDAAVLAVPDNVTIVQDGDDKNSVTFVEGTVTLGTVAFVKGTMVDTFKVDFLINANAVTGGVETDNSELNVHVRYKLAADDENGVEISNLSEVETIVVDEAKVGDGKMFGIDDVRPGVALLTA